MPGKSSKVESKTAPKLDVKFGRKWVKALRSGKYTQCKSRLRKTDAVTDCVSHCCLGVAADVRDPKSWMRNYKEMSLMEDMPGHRPVWRLYAHELLPLAIANAIGITNEDQKVLSGMNDGGKSFSKIADYIEADLLPPKRIKKSEKPGKKIGKKVGSKAASNAANKPKKR